MADLDFEKLANVMDSMANYVEAVESKEKTETEQKETAEKEAREKEREELLSPVLDKIEDDSAKEVLKGASEDVIKLFEKTLNKTSSGGVSNPANPVSSIGISICFIILNSFLNFGFKIFFINTI